MEVRRWMSPSVALLRSDTGLLEGRRLLEGFAARFAVVTARGMILGVVDRFQIHPGEPDPGGRAFPFRDDRTLRNLVPEGVPALAPHDTVETAASVMLEAEVSLLPVVDEDYVVGVLAMTDLLRAMIELMDAGAQSVRMVATTPAEMDLLDDLKRHSHGLAIRSLVARPRAEGGWETMMRLSGRAGRARCG